jgi:putative FmdB family regulatory protein
VADTKRIRSRDSVPTYEYRCPEGHEFEKFQRMSDPPGAECPECGAAAKRILSGGAGLLFKGEGFYITDYRSDSYKKDAAKESGGKSGGESSEKKSEKKSDATSKSSSSGSSDPKPGKSSGSKE